MVAVAEISEEGRKGEENGCAPEKNGFTFGR